MVNRGDFEFFLSEIFEPSDECAGHIIELMRSAAHIHSFRRLLAMLASPESEQFDQIANEIQDDPLRVLVMNFSASQLRESLKLFARFAKLPHYAQLRKRWTNKQIQNAHRLMDCVNQFEKKTGLLYSILKPLRDNSFHYDPTKAMEWVQQRMKSEKQEKPPICTVRTSMDYFGPGLEYDESLFSRYLFWNGRSSETFLRAQIEVWDLQLVFLKFVKGLTETLMKKANVPPGREFGWCLRYRYGFRRPSGRRLRNP